MSDPRPDAFFEDPFYTEAEHGIPEKTVEEWKQIEYFEMACKTMKHIVQVFWQKQAEYQITNGKPVALTKLSDITILDIGGGAADNVDKQIVTTKEEVKDLANRGFTPGQIKGLERSYDPWMLRAAAYLGIGKRDTRVNLDIQKQSDVDRTIFKHCKEDFVAKILNGGNLRQSLHQVPRLVNEGFDIIMCNNVIFSDVRVSSPQFLDTLRDHPTSKHVSDELDLRVATGQLTMQSALIAMHAHMDRMNTVLATKLVFEILGYTVNTVNGRRQFAWAKQQLKKNPYSQIHFAGLPKMIGDNPREYVGFFEERL